MSADYKTFRSSQMSNFIDSVRFELITAVFVTIRNVTPRRMINTYVLEALWPSKTSEYLEFEMGTIPEDWSHLTTLCRNVHLQVLIII
jgi:hypothetical protein